MPLDNDLEPEIVINGYDYSDVEPSMPSLRIEPILPRFEEPQPLPKSQDELTREWQALRELQERSFTPVPEPHQRRSELTFTAIQPPDLGKVWPWVRKGLLEVLERNLGRASWTPAHVRHALLQNTASLFVVQEDTQPVAFVVITIQNDPFLLVPTVLHVWAEYSATNDWRAADFAHQEVIALGKRLCLERIEMASTRAAWARRLQSIGMKPAMTIYALDLNEVPNG